MSTSPLEAIELCDTDYSYAAEHKYAVKYMSDNLSLFSKEIVAYIAGFVVKTMENKIQCCICLSALREDNEGIQSSLIHCENCGGLIFIVYICNMVESMIRFQINTSPLGQFNKQISDIICAKVLNSFVGKEIFKTLEKHSLAQSFQDNHILYLIKSTVYLYIKIRLHHTTKSYSEKLHKNIIRHRNLKTTLFLGQ